MQTQNTEHLQAPALPQLNQDGTLDLATIAGGVEVRIPVYPGMQAGDRLAAHWHGTPPHPLIQLPALHTVQRVEEITLWIPATAIHDKWQTLKVWYNVHNVGSSAVVEVDVV